MKVKELRGKYGRPDWNPAVEITFEGTKCMVLAIEESVKKAGFENGDDFIRHAIRNHFREYGIKPTVLLNSRRHQINE